ncbi:MAG: hypothetical protein GY839_01125 [candidate division Zixibacteria bacterium]|nr:hypothetical protein [candidate division Zixibacteria bacterium]
MKKFQFQIGLLLLLAAGVIITGCSVEKPEAPSWETTWDMPLTNKTYTIEEIIEEMDSEEITFDSLGNPGFSISQEIDTIAVENNLTSPAVNQTYSDSLGIIDIDAPIVPPTNFALADLSLPIVIDVIPIDTSFSINEDLSAFGNFDWADISAGEINIEVANDLGIDIDSLAIGIYNTSDLGTPIGFTIFETGIADDQTLNRQIDLAGERLENALTLITFGVVDSQGIVAPANDMVITTTFPSGLSVSGAMAEIPGFTKDLNQVVDLGDESVIYEAEIDDGSMTLQIDNGTSLPMNVSLSIPNFDLDGSALTIDESIAGNNTLYRVVDLTDYTFTPSGISSPQTISIDVSAVIVGSAPTKYLINSSDNLDVSADVSEITFRSVMGRIESAEITIDPMSQDVDIPDEFAEAQLTQAELRMILYNNSTTEVYVDLLLENESGSRSLVVQDTIQARALAASTPLETEIIVESMTLSAFLNPAPSIINISGTAILNPAGDDSVRISKDDFFYGEVEIYSPLAFALSDTIEIELDASDVEIDSEDLPDFEETFAYGTINAELTSHLPVGARVALYIGFYADDRIFSDPNSVVVGPFTLEQAETDVNGYAIEEAISVFNDSLTSSEIVIFENDIVYIAPQVQLLPTGAGGSAIQGSDYINITATARVKVNAGEHLWEDDNDN